MTRGTARKSKDLEEKMATGGCGKEAYEKGSVDNGSEQEVSAGSAILSGDRAKKKAAVLTASTKRRGQDSRGEDLCQKKR